MIRPSIALALSLTLVISSISYGAVTQSKNVQLTVYNGNFALVRDVRGIDLAQGVNSIEVEDVAATIDATSVLFKCLTAPNSVGVLEQNYQYDLISPDNILNKSVGQKAAFEVTLQNGGKSVITGTILNPVSNGGLVIRTDDGSIVLRPSGQVSLERMPEGLHPKPTLNWLLQSSTTGSQDVQISYIANNIGWRADYVALVNDKETTLDLSGWVTLNNNSGTTYKNAHLTLMAGDVRRVTESRPLAYSAMRKMAEDTLAAPQFQEKSFFEYHLYSLQRPTTVADSETKQISLLNASDVPVTKEYIYDGRRDWWLSWWYPGRADLDPGVGNDTSNYKKINVVLEFTNSEKNHLGMPLPAGKIRVYKLDTDGSQQFIGEDNIDHTPKDEKIRLYMGDAFDVVGEYKRIGYEKIAPKVIEESFEIRIRNHKKEAVTVKAIQHVWGDWKVTAKTADFVKKDAQSIEFPLNVKPDSETVLTFTVRTKI